MVAGLQEHRWSQYTSYSRTTWLTRVCQFAEKHISPRLIHQGEQISPGAWLGICVRGNRKSGGTHISATAAYKLHLANTGYRFTGYTDSACSINRHTDYSNVIFYLSCHTSIVIITSIAIITAASVYVWIGTAVLWLKLERRALCGSTLA